jgi:hydroxymethylpyrimidine/phosphomethylpyrimidine kinase
MSDHFQRSNDISPVVLTIAGFDPSGGAGIIADVKTITAFGCIPVAAVTSLTLQNQSSMRGAIHQTADSLRSQMFAVLEGLAIDAVKTGMLPTREIVSEVARLIRERKLPAPVVDPVMRSSSRVELMDAEAVAALLAELMPLAGLITPNLPEAEVLTGKSISNENEMLAAAARLRRLGAGAVLIKGGHLDRTRDDGGHSSEKESRRSKVGQVLDVLDNDGVVTVFRADWIDGPPVRGTGCMLSSAIAAGVARGMKLEDSVSAAREYVARAIREVAQLETRNSQPEI